MSLFAFKSRENFEQAMQSTPALTSNALKSWPMERSEMDGVGSVMHERPSGRRIAMNDKTLVERLRNLAEEWFEMCDDIHEPLSEAADTIEAMQLRIEALEARLEIEPSHPYDGIDARDATIRLLEKRIETFKSRIDALEAALRDYMSAFGQALEANGIPFSKQQLEADEAARQALENKP